MMFFVVGRLRSVALLLALAPDPLPVFLEVLAHVVVFLALLTGLLFLLIRLLELLLLLPGRLARHLLLLDPLLLLAAFELVDILDHVVLRDVEVGGALDGVWVGSGPRFGGYVWLA